MIVHGILLIIMIIVGLSVITTTYWGARLCYHIMKYYPEKRRRYLLGFRTYKLLDKEQNIDEVFVRLRSKFKHSQNIMAGAMLIAIASVLLLVVIAAICRN